MTKLSHDIFFLGPKGFGEHIQIESEDIADLTATRSKIIQLLEQVGAEPLPRDKKTYATSRYPARAVTGPGNAQSPMVEAAKAAFPGVTEDLGVCPESGHKMVIKNRKDGTGSFVACSGYPTCNYIKRQ